MTTHTPAPAQQAVLTDEEINDICERPASNTTMRAENDRALARATEQALLSKLRAPVADESPMAKMAEALREKARQEQQAYQDRRNQATEWGPMPEGTEADRPIPIAPVAHVAGDETSRYLEWAKDRSAWEMPVGTPVYYAALASAPSAGQQPIVHQHGFAADNQRLRAINESLDKQLEEVMTERDNREDVIDKLLDIVLGADRSEWSSEYGYGHAVIEVEERMHALASAPVAGEAQERIEQMAVNRYRPVPDGKFSYKVVAGDGSRSLYTGTKDSCLRVAAKLTEAFLDGAFVASDAAPQASAENVRNGTASKRYSDIDFDGWIAMHCDCDDLTAYERKLARDAWDAAMASHQGEPVDLPRIDADRLRAIAASGSQTAMSNALLNVARALKTQADKDGGQQRAGDELTHLRAENQRLRNGVDQDIAEVDRLQALYDSEWRKCKKLRAAFDHPVFAFLLGEGQLHGVDFGERAPGAVGKWWWRKDLRAALSAPQAEQGERDA